MGQHQLLGTRGDPGLGAGQGLAVDAAEGLDRQQPGFGIGGKGKSRR
jgi:hypothetical protein